MFRKKNRVVSMGRNTDERERHEFKMRPKVTGTPRSVVVKCEPRRRSSPLWMNRLLAEVERWHPT